MLGSIRTLASALVALVATLALSLGLGTPAVATPAAPAAKAVQAAKAKVKLTAKVAKSHTVGERPVVRVQVRATVKGRKVPVTGKVVVRAPGKSERVTVNRRGKAKVRLAELTTAGKVKIKVTFKGRQAKGPKLPTRTITKTITVEAASWDVPDEEMRAQIRSALGLPEGRALTLAHAAALNNTNGAKLYFGSVKTAAGLEVATNLTELSSFTADDAQDSRGLDNIVRVNGEFWISNAIQDAVFPKLAYVAKEVEVFGNSTDRIRSLSMPELTDAGSLEIVQHPLIASLSLPKLKTVRGVVDIDTNPALAAVDLPALTTVAKSLRIEHVDSAASVRLPALADAESLSVSDLPRAATLDLTGLATVRGYLRVVNLPLVGALKAPALTGVTGDLTVYGLASITEFAMPQLQWARGSVTFGLGNDFAALPRNGAAVSFPAFDVAQATGFEWSAKDKETSSVTDRVLRWNEFLAHFGVV